MPPKEGVFSLLILYGSETGNCEELAKRIGRQAIDRSLPVRVCECDQYMVSDLIQEQMVLLICSTTGVGEEPNNMKTFWKFIRRRDLPNDSLSSVYVSVIGLGDSSYEKYNFVAKKVHKRLIGLGAMALTDLVLGDEQHDCGPNAAIDPWLPLFWTQVLQTFTTFAHLAQIEETDQLFSASYNVRFVDHNYKPEIKDSEEWDQKNGYFDKQNPYFAKVLANDRMTSEEHFQDVRLIKLEINEQKLKYNSGDICYVKPENSDQNIDKLVSLLNLDTKRHFVLEKTENNWMSRSSYYNNLPKPCSVLTLVTHYMDIQSIPKRSFFDLLYRFSRSDLEKQKLKDFAKSSSSDDLYEYCNRPKRNVLEVLSDFPNTTPYVTFEYLFDLIPALNPRPFSIASALNAFPNELHLLVAIVNYRTRLKEARLGLCSNWLANQLPSNSAQIPIYIRKGSFKMASDSTPIILIGPGTGVAPFRAFIEDRAHRQVSNNLLFFGCRYRNSDFYLEDEWKRLKELGFLEYFVAFSRDSIDHKVYVQHILWQQRHQIWSLINDSKACIYVSGNSKQMPTQVRQTICDILREKWNQVLDNEKIEQMVNNLELKGRIQYECWS